MKIAGLAVILLFGTGAFLWIGPGEWDLVREELLIFLSILCAALIQVMVTTLTILRPEDATAKELGRLSIGLRRQQNYWIGLFCVAVFAVMLLIVGNLAFGHLEITLPKLGEINLDAGLSALTGAMIGFVFFHSFAVLTGILSLQRLRNELVRRSAERREATEAGGHRGSEFSDKTEIPANYGEVIRHPS